MEELSATGDPSTLIVWFQPSMSWDSGTDASKAGTWILSLYMREKPWEIGRVTENNGEIATRR